MATLNVRCSDCLVAAFLLYFTDQLEHTAARLTVYLPSWGILRHVCCCLASHELFCGMNRREWYYGRLTSANRPAEHHVQNGSKATVSASENQKYHLITIKNSVSKIEPLDHGVLRKRA